MLKNNARLWDAVRSLRGKKDKLLDTSQHSDSISDVKDEEIELESELEIRVKLWLSESSAPTFTRSPATDCKDQNCYVDACRQIHATPCVELASNDVLYHPDFADWASIHPTQSNRAPSPAQIRPNGLLQVLDDATLSLSKLLIAPFGVDQESCS